MALNSAGVQTSPVITTVAHVATGAGSPVAGSSAVNGRTRINTDWRRAAQGRGTFRVSGTFVGTVILEKSYDNGLTWLPARDTTNVAISLTAPGYAIFSEHERDVAYRSNCTAFTSGTATAVIAQ